MQAVSCRMGNMSVWTSVGKCLWRELDIGYCLVNWKELMRIWYHKKNYKSLRHCLWSHHSIDTLSQGLLVESRSVIRVPYHVSRINHTHKPFCGQNPSAALLYPSIHYTSLPTSDFVTLPFSNSLSSGLLKTLPRHSKAVLQKQISSGTYMTLVWYDLIM